MSNEKNLKPFEKGVSGNPSGRPKWKHVTEVMKQELDEDKLISMVHMVYDLAMEGNMRAVEFIADRLEGKVAQRVELSTKSDQPIKVFDIEGIDDDEKSHTELLEHVTTDSNH